LLRLAKKEEAMTLRELLERYADLRNLTDRTIALYGYTIDRFADFLGREPNTEDLDDLIVSRFLRWRAKTPHGGKICSPASVQKDKTQLQALWTYAARKRWAADFPELPRLRVPRKTAMGKAYTAEDVTALIQRARHRCGTTGGRPSAWWWSTFIYAAWCSGERLSALLSLKWEQVDLENRRILLLGEHRKGRTRDIVREITPELAHMLAAGRGEPDSLVWQWDRKQRGSIWASMKVLCKGAGVRYRGFHGIRRAAASYAALAGGKSAATALLDHSNPKLAEVYVDPAICPLERVAVSSLPSLRLDGRDAGSEASGGRPDSREQHDS
jgi:integrase